MGYHSKYFLAQAYWNMCQSAFDAASKAGKGMNIAAAYGKICVEKFNEARPFVNVLGGAYKANFDKKVQEAITLSAKAEDENKKIYYESIIAPGDIPKPDPQNFVNLTS